MYRSNALIRKLEGFCPLTEDDKRLLAEHCRNGREVARRTDLIQEGDPPASVHLVLRGFACRYKLLPDGGRQIVAYLVPGDFCDLHVFILKAMDHNISTLSNCEVVDIPRQAILELTERPAIARALWWATLVDEAILREWIVSMGRRPAGQRIGHMLCELALRLHMVGLAEEGRFELPVTQAEFADTLGLTPVHVNRILQDFRAEGLISLKRHEVAILDFERLKRYSDFDENYLHLRSGDNVRA